MINNAPNFTWRRKHLFQITNKTTTTATTKLFERHNIETTWGCHISWTWIWTYILNLNYIYPNYVNIINMFHFSTTLNSYTICLLFNLYPRKSQHAGGNCVFQRCKDLSRCGPVTPQIHCGWTLLYFMYDPKCSTTFPWCTINAPVAYAWCTINASAVFAWCTNHFLHKLEFSYIGWNGVYPLWDQYWLK